MFKLLFTLLAVISPSSPKEEIALAEMKLRSAPSQEKGEIYFDLALAHLADQDMERAIHYFITALKITKPVASYAMEEEEKTAYEKALSLYTEEGGSDPVAMSQKMVDLFAKSALDHENWHSLRMLLATAYANLDRMDLFFKFFYQSYPYNEESFLSYKTQGIIYLRLSQLVKNEEERRGAKKEAMRLFRIALSKYQRDPTLYRILIHFAKEEKKESEALSLIEEMVKYNVVIPRSDLLSYVKEAADAGKEDLANRLIEYGRKLYDYSRGLTALEEYVKQKRSS